MNQTRILLTAIHNGLAYLAQTQRDTGEFATFTSPRLDMAGAKERPKSVYVTTFVIHALAHLPPEPVIKQIQQQAGQFLIREQEENGTWHYDGRGDHHIPADWDSTACAAAALLQLGRRPDLSFYAHLWQNEVSPGGPYYTWLGVDHKEDSPYARDVDILVNANILFCAGLLKLALPGTATYLKQIIQEKTYLLHSTYCPARPFPLYALSRAWADGKVEALRPALPSLQNDILAQLQVAQTKPVAFDLACLTVSLLNSGAPLSLVKPHLVALLGHQQEDGRWPAWGVYRSYARHYDGAPALTTALALEASGKYLSQSVPPKFRIAA